MLQLNLRRSTYSSGFPLCGLLVWWDHIDRHHNEANPQNVENSPPTPYSRHKPLILKINADIWWEGMQPPTTGAHVDLCGHSCVGVTKCCDPCLKDGCP